MARAHWAGSMTYDKIMWTCQLIGREYGKTIASYAPYFSTLITYAMSSIVHPFLPLLTFFQPESPWSTNSLFQYHLHFIHLSDRAFTIALTNYLQVSPAFLSHYYFNQCSAALHVLFKYHLPISATRRLFHRHTDRRNHLRHKMSH